MKKITMLEPAHSSPPTARRIIAIISVLGLIIFLGGFFILPLGNIFLDILFILIIVGMLYFVVDRIIQFYGEMVRLQSRIQDIEKDSITIQQRLAAVLQLSRKFVEANEEKDVVELLIRLSVELVGSVGASFVPIDERGQPLTAVSFGDLPAPVMSAWFEYLASPAMRNRCGTCQNHGILTHTCPLVQIPFSESDGKGITPGIYCLPLRRGDREFGVLNLYMPEGNQLDDQSQEFLRAMLDETSLAIESIRMRQREIDTIRQLRAVQRRTDLPNQLQSFLVNVQETLNADFVLLLLQNQKADPEPLQLSVGEYPVQVQELVNSLMIGVLTSAKPLLLGEIERENPLLEDVHSLIVVPLIVHDGQAVGALLSANLRSQNFYQRHLSLLQTLASQVTLEIQNFQLIAEIEYKTLMAERTRLAREIHDGLAQTLGFLKLQNAQMLNYQNQKNDEKLKESLVQSYRVLSEAYLEARQAIDGLRISTEGHGLLKWLKQTLDEFEENSGIQATLEEYHEVPGLAPEVQAQVIRIVQEALSNVRKHANANGVWVSLTQQGHDLILEIRDNGCGFEPEDIPSTSRYGLRGMRERSELIGADFQVISRLHEGTIIRIRLPLTSGVTIQ